LFEPPTLPEKIGKEPKAPTSGRKKVGPSTRKIKKGKFLKEKGKFKKLKPLKSNQRVSNPLGKGPFFFNQNLQKPKLGTVGTWKGKNFGNSPQKVTLPKPKSGRKDPKSHRKRLGKKTPYQLTV